MPRSRRPEVRQTSNIRRVFVSDCDVAAAQRLLSVLSASAEPSKSAPAPADALSGSPGLSEPVQQAQLALGLRQRRVLIFGARFSGEPPFALLTALYVHEQHESVVTLTRLTQLASINLSTAIRWLDLLAEQGWVGRSHDGGDRRKTLLSLSDKGRSALNDLFSWAAASENP